ncbi:hypothetical protein C8R43DRAFT_923753 [Mycena crocata]|nr:hypothetical protein C8R43DRAFT_923753 [Mycena crocata]
MTRKILPTLGACVVLTIDPIASLDPELLEDHEAIEACKSLVSKKYVALMARRTGLFQPSEPYNTCQVEFILQGRPRDFPERCIEPSMSIPIVPVTSDTHPSSRIPMEPSTPLPWNDCYVSTFWAVMVRCRTLWTEDPIDCRFSIDELHRHNGFLIADLARQRALCEETGRIADRASPTANPHSVRAIDSTQAVDRLSEDPSPKPIITVNFSHALSTVNELNDPADYYKEVEALAKIQEEAWRRIAEARARAIKAAAAVDAELYDEKTLNLLVERPTKRQAAGILSKSRKTGKSVVRRLICWVRPAFWVS